MARQRGFWTTKRLKELNGLYKRLTPIELERYYGKRWEEILQAYEFQRKHKKMKISVERRNGVRTTVYAAAYADGIIVTSFESLHVVR